MTTTQPSRVLSAEVFEQLRAALIHAACETPTGDHAIIYSDARVALEAAPTSREAMLLEALELAMDNLRQHGDNCFLHDEGEYNSCFCGKDSLVNHLQNVVEEAAIAAAKEAKV